MIITISICDDDNEQSKYLRSILTIWSGDKPFAVNIMEYESAESFLFDYSSKPCDILLLDIEMGGISGMELAKKLRFIGDMLPIIFITGYSDYISDGYDVEALHYLLKPVNNEKLLSVLDRYTNKQQNKSDVILIEYEGKITHIETNSIVFIEAFGRNCNIVTADGKTLPCEKGIGEFKVMNINNFIMCHRSYYVNLRYISSISKNEITLDNAMKIPLSRRLYNDVNNRFIEYYTGEK